MRASSSDCRSTIDVTRLGWGSGPRGDLWDEALGEQGASFARNLSGLKWALLAGVSMLSLASLALAGPEGGSVVAGTATISTPAPTRTQIDQATDKAIVNWNSFNVGSDESAVFIQPTATSVT